MCWPITGCGTRRSADKQSCPVTAGQDTGRVSDPVSHDVRRGRIQWRVLPIVWLAIKKTCTAVGAFVLVMVFLSVLMLSGLNETAAPPLPQKMALYLEFSDGFMEKPSGSPLAGSFNLEPATVHQVVDAIDLAAKDERVLGIMARMDGVRFPPRRQKRFVTRWHVFARVGNSRASIRHRMARLVAVWGDFISLRRSKSAGCSRWA